MEIVDIYEKCPGKGRLDDLKENLESLRRRVDHEVREIKEEVSMVEKTITKLTTEFTKLGFKILWGFLGFAGTAIISLVIYIYMNNIK